MNLPISDQDLDRQLVRKGGLYHFMRLAWNVVESTPFTPGWHLEEICNHLEAVSRGEIRRLIINVPPGTGKSLTVSVFWPTWDWLTKPWRKWMFSSFDATLSQRDALRAKELITSSWFQERWGFKADQRRLKTLGLQALNVLTDIHSRQNTATIYWTNGGGLRFSTSVAGKSTGWHSHIQVVDDPVKPADVKDGGEKARTALANAEHWWRNTMASRKADPQDFSRVIIMQRLHAKDLAGVCIVEGGWTVLNLPMEFDPNHPAGTTTSLGGDRRTEPGELLWPDRYTAESVAETVKDMGPRVAAAQMQQRPSPEGGTVFQRDHMGKRWLALPHGVSFIQSWDCTFKGAATSDYVVGQVWASMGGQFFLVDQVRARMDLVATCQAVRDMRAKWPKARKILVEDKANGPAVVQTLQTPGPGYVPGLVLFNPGSSGKVERANAVFPYFHAGDVWLPEAPWTGDYVQELADFPTGAHDDQVDATTQALLYLTDKAGRTRLAEAMAKVRKNG